MNTRKVLSIVTASAVLTGALSGCALLGGKDKAAVTDTVTGYIDFIMAGKYNKSAKLVEDEEDYFANEGIDEVTAGILDAVWDAASYEIGEVEVKNDSAAAEAVFSLPDLQGIADDGLTYDDFIAAIEDIDEVTEETFSFDLTKDGDEWLIEGDSTEDFYDFLTGYIGDIEFAGLSEATAVSAVDEFISYLAGGDLDSALLLGGEDPSSLGYSQDILAALGENYGSLGDCIQSYFSQLAYESEVTASDDESITVTVTGTAPDPAEILEERFNDPAVMAPIMADFYYNLINDSDDQSFISSVAELYEIVNEAVNEAEPGPYTGTFVVSENDDGTLRVMPQSDVMQVIETGNVGFDDEEITQAAFELLLEQGRITQAQYNEYMGYDDGDHVPDTGYNYAVNPLETGDDFYTANLYLSSGSIQFVVVTWDYYGSGDTFEYELTGPDGSTISSTYEISGSSEDHIYIDYPCEDDPSGTYELTIYDEGSSTSVLAVIDYIIVNNDGSVTPDQLPLTGDSGEFVEFSSDCYSFVFNDSEGNYIYPEDGDELDEASINFTVRTWDYYADGETMDCAIFRDGELVGNLSEESDPSATDTFYFNYAPQDLQDGDYAFVLFDVNADSVYGIAYATVGN